MRAIATAAVLFTCIVASCADDENSTGESAEAETPASEVAGTGIDGNAVTGTVFTATQTEDSCTLMGPSEVPAGETYYLVIKDVDGTVNSPYVSLLVDGKTAEDFAAPQEAPGENYPKPDFVVYATSEYEATIPFNEATDLAEDETSYAYSSEPGPHVVYTSTVGNGLWICGSFDAT